MTSPAPRINAYIAIWGKAGIVTRMPRPADGSPFPPEFWVEQGYAIDPADPAIPRLVVEGKLGIIEASGPPLPAETGNRFAGAAPAPVTSPPAHNTPWLTPPTDTDGGA